jgi:hypothetical protein
MAPWIVVWRTHFGKQTAALPREAPMVGKERVCEAAVVYIVF